MPKPVSDNVYFIGIGGVGMSGIARVAHDQGLHVEGSDIKESRFTKPLTDAGITVHIGHKAENLPDTGPTVVISTAILEDNAELIRAQELGLNIVRRAEMLAHLGRSLDTVAVAGTHGKTTTSSMLASTRWASLPRSSSGAWCVNTAPTPIRARDAITW
jgi:UDP-N-acetylmuramate--alanine ligase